MAKGDIRLPLQLWESFRAAVVQKIVLISQKSADSRLFCVSEALGKILPIMMVSATCTGSLPSFALVYTLSVALLPRQHLELAEVLGKPLLRRGESLSVTVD